MNSPWGTAIGSVLFSFLKWKDFCNILWLLMRNGYCTTIIHIWHNSWWCKTFQKEPWSHFSIPRFHLLFGGPQSSTTHSSHGVGVSIMVLYRYSANAWRIKQPTLINKHGTCNSTHTNNVGYKTVPQPLYSPELSPMVSLSWWLRTPIFTNVIRTTCPLVGNNALLSFPVSFFYHPWNQPSAATQ